MAACTPRARGHIRRRRSSFQVLVYAGMDESVPIPAGQDGERAAEKARTRMLAEVDRAQAARTTATVTRAVEEWYAVAELEATMRLGYRSYIDRSTLTGRCLDDPPDPQSAPDTPAPTRRGDTNWRQFLRAIGPRLRPLAVERSRDLAESCVIMLHDAQ